MGGAFITNLIWWGAIHIRKRTWSEYIALPSKPQGQGSIRSHYIFGMLAGILWYLQFFFYGLGHVRMGGSGFISWGIHMAMLIFFSFGIGLILKEWKGLGLKTISVLLVGLAILLGSFILVAKGSIIGENADKAAGAKSEVKGH
jgi:L-rhamnose-H+ transport protein